MSRLSHHGDVRRGPSAERSRSAGIAAKLPPGPGRSPEEVARNQRARLRAAMIELVADHGGFEGVSARALYRAAGISSAAFYRHFDDAEDCFCKLYEGLMRAALQRAIRARDSAGDAESGVRAALRSLMVEVAGDPAAASLVFIGVFTAGPGMLPRMRVATARFERFLGETLARAPIAARLPPQIPQAMSAGIARVIRTRLLTDRAGELPACADPLAAWMLELADPRVLEVGRLGAALAARPDLRPAGGGHGEESWAGSLGEERTRILAAIARLGAEHGYWRLTPTMIRKEAGVSRARFDAQFEDVGACFLEAVQALVIAASAQAERHSLRADTWERGVYRAAFVLCGEIARNPAIAQLGFADLFAPGRGGMECRRALIDLGTRQLRRNAPTSLRPSEMAAEASLAGAWQLTYEEIIAGRSEQLLQIAPVNSWLTLAPTVGGPAALAAIRAEQYRLTAALPEQPPPVAIRRPRSGGA
jgi:AcrR family transcriptional regulator